MYYVFVNFACSFSRSERQHGGDAAQGCELVLETRHLGSQICLLPVQDREARLLHLAFGSLRIAVLPRELRVSGTMGAPFVVFVLSWCLLLGATFADRPAAGR